MKAARAGVWLLAAMSLLACGRRSTHHDNSYTTAEPDPPEEKGIVLADLKFRPDHDGFKFENQGGKFPDTPPVLDASGVATIFGKDACVSGNTAPCRMTPAATEFSNYVNRAMNGGQCEGMAVGSAAFFKHLKDPHAFSASAKSAHDLNHAQVGPLIGQFWALQVLNPVRGVKTKSLLTQTPKSVEDTLVASMKRGEFSTIAIRTRSEGHAVTPYAVEDHGNGIHWIKIYDNNWPDRERHIIIDRNANSWRYDVAATNPNVPEEPWSGDADTHTIAVVPLATRFQKAECPFCKGSKTKMVVPHGTNGVTLTNHEGKRLGMEGDKMINEIPEAEVVNLEGYLNGASGNDVFIVPADADYQISIAGNDKKVASNHTDDMHGVSVFSEGQSVTVDTPKLNPNETDTLSVHRDGPIKYKTGSGKIPPMHVAVDHDNGNGGVLVHLSNVKADKGDEVELHVNRAAGHVLVQGGGKKADGYDIRMTHVSEKDDTVVEQKGVKFHAGESHKISLDHKPGAQQLTIARGKASPISTTSTTVAKPATTPATTPAATPATKPATTPARSLKR